MSELEWRPELIADALMDERMKARLVEVGGRRWNELMLGLRASASSSGRQLGGISAGVVDGFLDVDVMTVVPSGVEHGVRAGCCLSGAYKWTLEDMHALVHAGVDVVLGRRGKAGGLAVRVESVEIGDGVLRCEGAGW